MKSKFILSLAIIYLGFSISLVSAQKKVMMLNQELANNSSPMEVKAKGIGTVVKHNFGDYAIVSGKAGSIKENKGIKQQKGFTTVSNTQNLSFTLTKASDSVVSNSVYKRDAKIIQKKMGNMTTTEVLDGTDEFTSDFSISGDTTKWQLKMVTSEGKDIESKFVGTLKSNGYSINVKLVTSWSDGKSPLLASNVGYELYNQGKAIAGVQAGANSMAKKFVWISNNVPEELKLVLAAAAANILVMVDGQIIRK